MPTVVWFRWVPIQVPSQPWQALKMWQELKMRGGISGKQSPAFLWMCYSAGNHHEHLWLCAQSHEWESLHFLNHQCCSESLHKNEHGTQKTLCFFILPVSGGFKHRFARLQLVQCNGCSFLSICSDCKYCKSSQKLLMIQYQVSNPSWMLFLVGNFSSMEFLEHENHPLELLIHKAWLLQAFHHPHFLLSLSH